MTAGLGTSTAAPAGRRSRFGFTGAMMTPGVVVLALLSIPPFVALLIMSLSRIRLLGGVGIDFVWFDNWGRAFTDPQLWLSWLRTVIYFVATVGLEMVAGAGFALILWKVLRGRHTLLTIFLLPMFVAPVIVGLLGRYLTDSTFGLYAQALQAVGIKADVLGSSTPAFVAVVLMDVWEWTPLITLITLAGLSGVPLSIREAASLDGATGARSLIHIVLPSVSGVLMVALLIRTMDAIRYFDIIFVTTNGGPADATKTVPIRLYETAFRFFDLGYAAVIGLLLLIFAILVARALVRLLDVRGLAR
jgi:multiple sugar transport system permease protein